MIERLAADALASEYFIGLTNKASRLKAHAFFNDEDSSEPLSDKELKDLLQFSDILSNSKKPDARNKSYEVISLLNEAYKLDPFYKTFSHSVLAKLGNFPGLDYLKKNDNNNSELPFDRELEKEAKAFVQRVPETNGYIFTDVQFELYTKISDAKFFSFSGPTSMGKSFIIKSFIRKAIRNSPPENIVIMVPTRALINQFSVDFNKELKEVLEETKYKVVTNSNVSEFSSEFQHHFILVLTPERLISYLSQRENPSFGYLFVDEAHKIASEKDVRSVTGYMAISKALRHNSNLNLYFSSPNVSNPEVFLSLFKKDVSNTFNTIETPVSQNLYFVDLPGKKVIHYRENNPYQFTPALVSDSNSIYDILDSLGRYENNIVYCSSKVSAIDKAKAMYSTLQNQDIDVSRNIKRAIRQIKTYIHKDYYLADFLNKKIAYHFGNLPQIIRTKIEDLFKFNELDYVFCTSTLLEGVNLPAKNVFILNNKIGKSALEPIDFWNLAGRAGRLKQELSGNIICLKETETEWKKHEILLENRGDIILTPTVNNFIDKDLKKIEEFIKNNPDVKTKTKVIREILSYIANIISIDTLEIERSNYRSPIIQKLIAENKNQIIELAKEQNKDVQIPSSVLYLNQSVKLQIQDRVYRDLKQQQNTPQLIRLPRAIDYEICVKWLKKMYALFEWQSQENDYFKNEDQVKYYALLMNQWINGISLSSIINQSIQYYENNSKKIQVGYKESKPSYEIFNSSKHHINILIGEIIDDIEKILRFTLERYFNTYYVMLIDILGEENAGGNWAAFLEYGTQNPILIGLQNLGLSRHSANYLYTKHRDSLKIEKDKLVEVDLFRLKIMLSKDDIEFDEISAILF